MTTRAIGGEYNRPGTISHVSILFRNTVHRREDDISYALTTRVEQALQIRYPDNERLMEASIQERFTL